MKIILKSLSLLLIICLFFAYSNGNAERGDAMDNMKNGKIVIFDPFLGKDKEVNIVNKTKEEWKKELPADIFHITREKGTEKPFTGSLLKNKKKGVYVCSSDETPLFLSEAKYDSGTGWPSFFEPISFLNIKYVEDNAFFMKRTEVVCPVCGAHLGHVFNDGPEPTGKRYCINSLALKFISKE